MDSVNNRSDLYGGLMWENRPWGMFKVIETGPDFWVKVLRVFPNCRLSLQSHKDRSETWTVIRGIASVHLIHSPHTLVNGNRVLLSEGEVIDIPKGWKHRLSNNTPDDLYVIEVAIGLCDEGDICRFEDDYGRTKN